MVLVEIMHVLLIASKLFFDGEELKTLIFLRFCLDKLPFFCSLYMEKKIFVKLVSLAKTNLR